MSLPSIEGASRMTVTLPSLSVSTLSSVSLEKQTVAFGPGGCDPDAVPSRNIDPYNLTILSKLFPGILIRRCRLGYPDTPQTLPGAAGRTVTALIRISHKLKWTNHKVDF